MQDKYYDKIAVVGMGALFPDALNINQFWNNVINKKVSIKKLPEDMLEHEIFYRPELRTSFNKENKTYTNIAAYIEDIDFNTVRKFKIPPSVAEHMDPNQHAALYAADQALNDIDLAKIDKRRISVVFGNGSVGTRYADAILGVQYDKIKHVLKKHPLFMKYSEKEQEELFEYVRVNAVNESIPITEDSAPGILPNIIAARVSNVFDLTGPSYTIDSACASALTSVIAGIKSLRLNESDAVVCGAADWPIKSLGLIFFSAINALSPDGSFPFDERANGFVMGQGSGAIVLKRLEDAIESKDKIYAVINGYGEASDGKGKYIAAPNAEWQAYAIEKACLMAGYPVDTIELVEAHGTGTTVGDVVEVEGLKNAFSKLGYNRKNYCGLSSVKSNIGHLKSAAGIAGLIKAVLSLHHKKLPATASIEKINPKLGLENSPFYVLDESKEWEENSNFPRRANVSAFGFGGADYHLTLEEYREGDYDNKNFLIDSYRETKSEIPSQTVEIPLDYEISKSTLYFSGNTKDELLAEVNAFLDITETQKEIQKNDLIKFHNLDVDAHKEHRAAFLVDSLNDIKEKVKLMSENNLPDEILRSKGIYYKQSSPISKEEVAILFPGQASQYVNMFSKLRRGPEVFESLFDKADAYWLKNHNFTISSLIFSDDEKDLDLSERLKETQNTHPSIFLSSLALFEYLSSNGLSANYMIGHSLGEITALAAADKIELSEALKLVSVRGYSFKDAKLNDNGKMISVAKDLIESEKLVNECGIEGISIANINSKKQTIIAGSSSSIDAFKSFLDDIKISNKLLYVSHAFHTPLMEPVSKLFMERSNDIIFKESDINVIMNHSGEFYPNQGEGLHQINSQLADQILRPVNFVHSIEKLFDQGVRLFVEIGPNSILSSLTKNILDGKNATILTSNFKNSDDIESLQKLNASLFVEGMKLNPVSPVKIDSVITTKEISSEKEIFSKTMHSNDNVRVVYSGVSIGLPGSYKDMFRDDNFDQVFEGRNFIERLTDEERQRMVDLRISKLVKNEKGAAFQLLSSLEDVIQLAGKAGKIDMVKDYHIEENELKKMTNTISFGIAAAYEALKDAHIPLVQEYTKTSSGKFLPGKLSLPKYMQRDTGVIFANGFPMVDPIIEEVSRYIGYQYGSKTSKEIISFYESLISQVKDTSARKLLTDWFTLSYSRLNNISEEGIYNFNHNFMSQISSQANNRIAQLINAKGPNFQMNAACSSTSNAITIGEDFIRSGRVNRMIIVGADDSTSEKNLPFLGAGFLSTGAATNEGDLYKAAVPFDLKRNGMIMSAGAVGIILENKEEVRLRGVTEICELLGSHSFNTANHPAQIDSEGFSTELNSFITKMEKRHGLERNKLAKDTVYLSHETYTPPRGGCSQTEAAALSKTFNSNAEKLIIGNTKGMTGHAMGAALEEAIAAKSLQLGKIPPVVNLSEKDPLLSGLNISNGGSHNRSYSLRMSAGFGGQGHFLLLKKSANGDNRIFDRSVHQNWLNEISKVNNAKEELEGRILVVNPVLKESTLQEGTEQDSYVVENNTDKLENNDAELVKETISEISILESLSEMTSYPPEMLESDMEFYADLGIESQQQNEIANSLDNIYGKDKKELSINDSTTIGDIISHYRDNNGSSQKIEGPKYSEIKTFVPSGKQEEIKNEVVKIFSEVTKYPEDMLDLEMEMEADLGIDTVKQATILSMIGEKYRMERDDSLQLSDYPTIGHILDYVYHHLGTDPEPAEDVSPIEEAVSSTIESKGESSDVFPSNESNDGAADELVNEVIATFSEVTKYPEDMLELDMEMEADLGIDTVKQATILSILGEKYMLDQNEEFQLSDYPTIGHIVELLKTKGRVFNAEEVSTEVLDDASLQQNLPEKEYKTDSTVITELSRQIPVLVEDDLKFKTFELKDKKLLIIGNDEETNIRYYTSLSSKVSEVLSYTFPATNNIKDLLEDLKKLENVENFDIIVDTTFISNIDDQNINNNYENEIFVKLKSRFLFYKHLSANDKKPFKLICLISNNGSHGITKGNGATDPIYGAISGFYKALRKEWKNSKIKVIDFSHELLKGNFEFVVNSITDELEYDGNGFEIAYENSNRKIVMLKDRDSINYESIDFTENDTFLITGGASGITFLITKALAERYKSNFVLLGRTEIPSNIIELSGLNEEGLEDLRTNIGLELKGKYEKVTPKMINDKFNAILHAIDIYKNLKSLDSENIKYLSCDVKDFESLRITMKRIRDDFGPITALIHGAGIDKSKFLEDKNIEDFDAVFDTKALGAVNLEKLLAQDSLKLISVLSSISGRFGNAAQVDYSAANGFLNTWIVKMQNIHKEANAFSFSTSGWKDLGMAWRNEFVRKGSVEMGLNLIESDLGVNAFVNEVENKNGDLEIIIHKGLNGFIEKGLTESKIDQFPFLDRIIVEADEIKRAYRMFSPLRDAFLDQHKLGETPIMPAVGYSEIGAQYYCLNNEIQSQFLFNEISFENPFKLFRGEEKELFVEEVSKNGESEFVVEIKSNFNPKHTNITNTITHSRMIINNQVGDYQDMIPSSWNMEKTDPVRLPASESLMLIEGEGPKQRIVLGPLYNDIVRDTEDKSAVTIYPRSVIYPTKFPSEQFTNKKYPLDKMFVNPCFLDTLYQSCAAHLLVTRKRVYLPWFAQDLGIISAPKEEGIYTCFAQMIEDSEDIVKYRVSMLDENNNIRYFVRNIEFRKINL